MLEKPSLSRREFSVEHLILCFLLSAAFGYLMGSDVGKSKGEQRAIEWAIQTSEDCDDDEYYTIGECLQDRYDQILDERYAEAAAEQYP